MSRREELYDTYLERLLQGVEVDPVAYLEREGLDDPELLAKLQSLHLVSRLVPSEEAESSPSEGLPCERIGSYRMLRPLGRGGMGEVYLAEQENLGRQVAVKILQASAFPTAAASLRFHREARSLAQLRHPSVVSVIDFGVEDGLHYLVMEYIPGEDLSTIIHEAGQSEEAIPPSQAVRWAAEIARALERVHAADILHRDVKSSNIRITPEGRAVLVDFGLAARQDSDGPTLTRSFLGSPAYASPEQVRGTRALDARTDVYSLGVTLFRCVTGRLPFEGEELETLFHRILSETPPLAGSMCSGLPQDLEVILQHVLEKDPERRYSSAVEFADDLEALLAFRPIRAKAPALHRRVGFWVRSHRATAAALLTAALALASVASKSAWDSMESEHARLAQAEGLLRQAEAQYQDYLRVREEIQREALAVHSSRDTMESSYVSRRELENLARIEDGVVKAGLERERLFNKVLESIDQAQALDPSLEGCDSLRARVFLQRHHESEEEGERVSSRFYLSQAQRWDPSASALEDQLGTPLRFHSSLPGEFRIEVFRYEEQSRLMPEGDPRMAPLLVSALHPASTENGIGATVDPPYPGQWCLTLEQEQGPLAARDLIFEVEGWPLEDVVLVSRGTAQVPTGSRLLEVDGAAVYGDFELDQLRLGRSADGSLNTIPPPRRSFRFQQGEHRFVVEAENLEALGVELQSAVDRARAGNCRVRLWRDGEILERTLSSPIQVRLTTQPLISSPKVFGIPMVSGDSHSLPQSFTLLRLSREGSEDILLSYHGKSETSLDVELEWVPTGTTPAGYRRVVGKPVWQIPSFWIAQHEVRSDHYLQFLNSPRTQQEIAEAAEPVLFPRTFRNAERGGLWPRDADGLFRLPPDWPAAIPVVAISWFDAQAYARWMSEEAQAAGLPYRFRLPGRTEFRTSARGAAMWPYPYGLRFRPDWSNCCFSRPVPAAEPVLRYPIDESPLGVCDTSGSVLEWLDEWWDQGHSERFAAGGSWAQGGSVAAKPTSGLGLRPHETSMEAGFRLVLEIDLEPR